MVPSVVRSCFVPAAAAWMSIHHTADALHMDRLALSSPGGGIDEAAVAALKPDASAEVMPRHQGLDIHFVQHAGPDFRGVIANLSVAGVEPRYSVEVIQEMRPTQWWEAWKTEKCKKQRESQSKSEYFLECNGHRPIIWTPSHKLGYMKTAKAASTAFTDYFYNRFADAKLTFDPTDVPEDVFIFTFVREPFEHKLAAFAEVDLKTVDGVEKTGLDKSTFFQYVELGNAYARLWMFLDDVRFRRFQPGDARKPEHAGSQIGAAVCERTPDFIGHLEHLTADWDKIQELANLTTVLRTRALPIVHADTSEEHALYKHDENIAMDDALKKNMCKLYRSEFACLGYSTPEFCSPFLGIVRPID